MAELYTPYRFTPNVVRQEVESDTAGSYVLGVDAGDGNFAPRYVGRSDHGVQGRLAKHDYLYKYEYFVYRTASGAEQAFQQECELWHGYRQRGYELDNKVHPAVPPGCALKCPFCDFADHMSALRAN